MEVQLYSNRVNPFNDDATRICPWKLTTGVRLFPDCQNVSGIGLLNKKACLFCLLYQVVLQTLFIKQETWYFLLNKQKRAPFSFNKQK